MHTSDIWQLACELYLELAEYPPAQRTKKIDSLNNINSTVRDLVLEMLKNDNLVTNILDLDANKSVLSNTLQASKNKVGHELDNYILDEMIGHGGMATVYKAHRTGADIQKSVAIKIFDKVRINDKLLHYFKSEQAILSRLNHPNIISMHHGGIDQQQVPFMVMDYVEDAQAIDEYVSTNKQSTEKIVSMVVKIAKALAYAHANLIVHSDLKPSNLLVDTSHLIKVVDFGIAHTLEEETQGQEITKLIAMTPGFAAPEQVTSEAVTVQSDIFSLGAVLLNLLTGKDPLPNDRLLTQCKDDDVHLQKTLNNAPLDKDLKNIINRALQHDPQRRYGTMQSFANDLQAWSLNEPVSATPDSWLYRIRKFSQRRPALFSSVLTLSLSLILALVGMLWQIQKTQLEAEKVNQVKTFMLNTFSVTDPDVKQGQEITATELLDLALSEIDPETDAALKAELLQSIGTAYGNLGNFPKAVEVLSSAYDINNDDSTTQIALLKYLLAEQQLDKVKPLTQKIEQKNDLSPKDKALLLQAKATLASSDKQFTDAETLYLEAIQQWQEIDDIYGLTQARREYAMVLDLHDKTPEAIQEVTAILLDIEGLIPENHSLYLKLQYLKAFFLTVSGEFEPADEIFVPLQQTTQRILGEEHPLYTNILMNRINVNRGLGQIDEAKQLAKHAHQIISKQYDTNHFNLGNLAQIRATLSMMQGDFNQALEYLKKASRIYKHNFGTEHQSYLVAQTDLANILNRLGQPQEAKTIIEGVYQTQLKIVGDSHRDTFAAESQLGLILSNLGEHDEAIAVQLKSLETARTQLGETSPLFLSHLFGLGKTYQAADKPAQAAAVFEEIYDKGLLNENDQRQIPFKKSFARTLTKLGQHEQAITLSQQMVKQTQAIFGEGTNYDYQNQVFLVEQLLSANQFSEARKTWPAIKTYYDLNPNPEMTSTLEKIAEQINQ